MKNIQNTEGFSTKLSISETNFISGAFPRNPNGGWTVNPNPNLPRKMSVLEQKKALDFRKDFENSLNTVSYFTI